MEGLSMSNKKDYLDQRNDFNGPEKNKGNYPKRPQHVQISEQDEKETPK